jgi:hypothetical protein
MFEFIFLWLIFSLAYYCVVKEYRKNTMDRIIFAPWLCIFIVVMLFFYIKDKIFGEPDDL